MDQPKYRAFLSYSHRDAKWAQWLHRQLESYRPPKKLVGVSTARGPVPKRLTPVFRDREELASATDLGSVITEALQQSACQIVICSPPAAKSRWVNEEILAFKRLGREDRIFCLIIAGEPNATDQPGAVVEECFPPALRFRLGADGQLSDVRTEPIAADARHGKDGRNAAKLKLIAGVLGVGYDALRRREQQRRNRRLFALTCSALAGMVVTSGLAGYALIAVLSVVFKSWIALEFWLGPMLLMKWFHQFQNVGEHTAMTHEPDTLSNTRTLVGPAVMRWLMWNMSYHAAHHTFPSIPFHRLPELDKALRAKGAKPMVTLGYIRIQGEIVKTLSGRAAPAAETAG